MALFGKKADQASHQASKEDAKLAIAETAHAHKHAVTSDGKTKETKQRKLKADTGDAYRILTKPVVTEKSYRGASKGKYVFKVNRAANKISVRKAVEKVYDVKVAKVNIVNVLGKAKRSGAVSGRTSNWKKAVVTLKPGQAIEEI